MTRLSVLGGRCCNLFEHLLMTKAVVFTSTTTSHMAKINRNPNQLYAPTSVRNTREKILGHKNIFRTTRKYYVPEPIQAILTIYKRA